MSTNVNNWEGLGYKELGAWIADKTTEQAQYFKSRQTNNGDFKMDTTEVEIVRSRNKELEDANKRYQELQEVDRIYQQNSNASKSINEPVVSLPFGNGNPNGTENSGQVSATKSLGELFTDSRTYKSIGFHNDMTQYAVDIPDVDFSHFIKATLTTAAGYAPANNRGTAVVDSAIRRAVVGDLVPTDATTVGVVKYMEETTFTNAAAGVVEGAAKPESTLVWTERSVPVEVIATYIPVTNQQLDDVPGIEGLINRRLTQMVLLKEEDYLLSGTGTPPQMTGFLVKAGTNSITVGADSNIDAIYKGMAAVRNTGFAEPTGIVIHPNNWTPIRLAKTTTGEYIYGDPSVAGPESLFGLPVIVTTAMTANTALTGDFRMFSHISRRYGITVIVGMINDDMIKNKKTILVELRESLEIYRATAFSKIATLST